MILDNVKNTVKKGNLLVKGDTVLVAVSGGPDSVSLLYLLKSLSRTLNLKLHIGHFDHMLRSCSGRDADFVKDLGRKLNIPVTISRRQVRKMPGKSSLEEAARDARFDFLFKTAKLIGADKIALGHNLDDQAETVLMRILRGAGLSGLSGILPKRNISGFEIIRPLINVERREIEAYLKKKRIKPRRDKTNLENIYLRNRIRNRLIPLLKKEYNPNITNILSNMAENVALDYDYLNQQAMRSVKLSRGKIRLTKLLRLHPAIQRLILRQGICQLQGSTRRISFQHIKEIEDLILSRPVNSIVDLPRGISVIKKSKSLVFYRR